MFNIPAPIKIGIAIKNENLVALERLIPSIIAIDIVIPDREIPGKRAIT